jgi:ABC-type transport system involved in multi-copper enzyme maturation permease subunit
MSGFWAIAKNAFIEIIRQPFYAALLAAGMTLIAVSPVVTMFSLVEDEKLLVDMGLATIALLGLIFAVLSVTQTISREIEVQTVGAILSKPVGRLTFVLAKFAGVTMVMAASTYLLTVVLVITLRLGVPTTAAFKMDWPALAAELAPFVLAVVVGAYCNYFFRWNFCSTAVMAALLAYTAGLGVALVVGKDWRLDLLPAVFAERHALAVVWACVLVGLSVWVMGSIALAASTRLNVMVNAILCVGVFFVGAISQFLFGQFADLHATTWPAWVLLFFAAAIAASILFAVAGPGHPWLRALGGAVLPACAIALWWYGDKGRELVTGLGSAYAWIAWHALPNLHFFWVGDKLMQEFPFIPPTYVALAAVYAAAYCATMVAFAAFLFERREVV